MQIIINISSTTTAIGDYHHGAPSDADQCVLKYVSTATTVSVLVEQRLILPYKYYLWTGRLERTVVGK
jgi:hypothetical protein